ncbi:CFA/I fimbrial subunit B [Escherichia coli 2726800]|uniref:CS14 major fimbrial subunit n=3 Tax=Escherichia coli TaxID=562 RepID=A0A0H5SCE9_ECOLX|nr:CS1 type fimbrial major subunit [Escherichia coli]EMX82354.1 CFA/I fimbrial subunit B [Escherichia coli 2726800]ENC06544.1 CFA/I fimbrial subunit B [Escherichia coli P0299438.4]OKW43818.1 fimbrial protein [Escherichia coli]CRZ21505.1 CS14 major fimbrial subunit [Escherichia coli]HAW8455032.1 fimbrial protein [Escherichia coli]
MKLKKTIGAMALSTIFVAVSASAVEKNITVTASVDPTIDILQANGSALPTAVDLTYLPGAKTFENYSVLTQIYTNDPSKGLDVRLVDTPKLTNILQPTSTIPLTVSWAGKTLSTSAQKIAVGDLGFGSTGTAGVSNSKELVIGATTSGTAPSAGKYQGVVSIVMTQSTDTAAPVP